MSESEELLDQLRDLVSTGRAGRATGWNGCVAVVVDGRAWATIEVDQPTIRVADPGAAAGTSIRARNWSAVRRWLVDGVDYTHLVASGEFVIDGVSFDVLLISKVLGLRPDRKVIAAS